MSKRTFTKRRVATPETDPVKIAEQKLLLRERERAKRALQKRRRAKSGQ